MLVCRAVTFSLLSGSSVTLLSDSRSRGRGGSGHPMGPQLLEGIDKPSETTETHPEGPAKWSRPG